MGLRLIKHIKILVFVLTLPDSKSETEATVVQNDTGDLIRLKKKSKVVKKKRLKEEGTTGEESRRCSDGQNHEPEASELPSEKTAENGKTSKQSTGMHT